MFILFMLLLYNRTEEISVNILYEKLLEPQIEQIHKQVIQTIIDRYNLFLSQTNIILKLEELKSFSSFALDNKYYKLKKHGGTSDLTSRMEDIIDLKGNYVVIASSPDDAIDDLYHEMKNPCMSKYITSFSSISAMDSDTLTYLILALQRWASKLFDYDMPNVFKNFKIEDLSKLSNHLTKTNFINSLYSCKKKPYNSNLQNYSDNTNFNEQFKNIVQTAEVDFNKNKIFDDFKISDNENNINYKSNKKSKSQISDKLVTEIVNRVKKELELKNLSKQKSRRIVRLKSNRKKKL